ncbi:BTAD domain-containing putative transcriptional regulator [Streptomyces sp. NPDC047072]|uniref:BTAD domain-containing putative transcriptional regulator n=1 Tax=Streptomyces sp. NPDC047072 TaxID=3154809 RepID=UPI0033ECB941
MLRIRVLGPLEADVRGGTVALGTPRQRALLALLTAARNQTVSVDRLTHELWRGSPPAKATASLHAYVSNLRRLLEPRRPPRTPASVLVTTPPGYTLRLSPDAVDAWRFEDRVTRARTAPAGQARELLGEALRWWRGPAFQEYADETWAEPEVARLNTLFTEARELAVAADLRTGHLAEAAATAEVLVREGPLREEGWRLLALAHWAAGRQSDALAKLRRATSVLRDELGCDPSPGLTELQHAVLTQRLEVLHTFAPPPRQESTARLGGGQGLFVGRKDELRSLSEAARAARRGGGLALVTGEAGAGKSALLAQLADRLRREGWTVVLGRCPEHEGAPPAWAWTEALGALARDVPPARPRQLAALLHDSDSAAAATRDEATAGRFRLHRALADWLREAAGRQPTAVLLEDLHRADGQTLALLEAAAEVTGVPLLIGASYRPAEVGENLVKALAHLAPLVPHRTALAGLSAGDVATVVGAVCGTPVDDATVAALAERTGGNPFYVWESARLLAGEGALVAVSDVPQGVRDVLRRRLALLPPEALAAVQLVAVAGLEADLALLVGAADLDEDAVLAGLDAAVAADLLGEPGPGRVRFVHALVRDTVYTDLSGIRRARLHDRIARQLRSHRPDDFAALAHHFAHSGRTANAEPAVDYALRAAETAERRYAHDVAVDLIRQALDTHTAATPDDALDPDRTVGLLVRLLGAQMRSGATDAARHTRQRAIDLAVRAGRDDLAASVHGAWTEPSPWRSRLEGFYDRTALTRLERLAHDRTLDGPTRARVLQALVDAVAAEDAPRAREAARTQLELARADGDPRLLASALMTSAKLLPHETHGEARTPFVEELRELALRHDLPAYRWVCEHLDTMTAAGRNDPAAVRQHTAEGLQLAHRYRMLWAQGINLTTSAMLAAITGEFAEAETGYAQADDLFQRVGTHHATGPRTLGLWTIRLTQGRAAEIEPETRDLYAAVGTPVAVAHALVLARLGRPDDARAVPLTSRPLADHLHGVELDYRSQLAVLLGDTDSAAALITDVLPLREQFAGAAGAAYATRPLAHALADLYRLVGEEQAAADAYALAEHVALTWGSAHHAAAARRAAGQESAHSARRRTCAR